MAKLTLRDARIWFAQYDLSAYHNTINLQTGKALQPSTAMGATWDTSLAGSLNGSLSGGGFWDMTSPVTPDYEYYNATIGATSKVISVSPDGGETNDIAYTMQALNGEYSCLGNYGDPAPFSIGATADGPVVRGFVLFNGTATGNANGTEVLYLPVVAGQTFYAALHVFGMTGSTAVVKVEHDTTGFPSAIASATFTAATAATSEWKTSTTATTDTYWRYTVSSWGTAGTLTFAVVIGIQ